MIKSAAKYYFDCTVGVHVSLSTYMYAVMCICSHLIGLLSLFCVLLLMDTVSFPFLRTQCYANAVIAMALCLSDASIVSK